MLSSRNIIRDFIREDVWYRRAKEERNGGSINGEGGVVRQRIQLSPVSSSHEVSEKFEWKLLANSNFSVQFARFYFHFFSNIFACNWKSFTSLCEHPLTKGINKSYKNWHPRTSLKCFRKCFICFLLLRTSTKISLYLSFSFLLSFFFPLFSLPFSIFLPLSLYFKAIPQ